MAIARSKAEPCLGTEAGERFTVMRRPGSASPEFEQAARTLDVASLSDASGKPTSTKLGKFDEMSASISMSLPPSPKSEIE